MCDSIPTVVAPVGAAAGGRRDSFVGGGNHVLVRRGWHVKGPHLTIAAGISVLSCMVVVGCSLFSSRVGFIERTETCRVKVTAASKVEEDSARRWSVDEDCVLKVEPEIHDVE
jgi:hypothetical protein